MPHSSRFCVIAQPRTGTEWLIDRLHRHPAIACHRDLFHPNSIGHRLPAALASALPTVAQRDAAPLALLDQVFALSGQAYPARPWFGFKLFLQHAQEVRRQVRLSSNWRLVVLERRNKLAQYASLMTANETRRWGSLVEPGPDGRVPPEAALPVTLALPEFLAWMDKETQRYARLRERLRKREGVLELNTEELDERADEVLGLLGLPGTLPAPKPRRQWDAPLQERVRNWAELDAWARANGHEDWLTI